MVHMEQGTNPNKKNMSTKTKITLVFMFSSSEGEKKKPAEKDKRGEKQPSLTYHPEFSVFRMFSHHFHVHTHAQWGQTETPRIWRT